MLLVPALATLSLLAVARLTYPNPDSLAARAADVRTSGLGREFWIYLAAVALVAAGFADFSLMAFHFARTHNVDPNLIPVFYAAAMGIGGFGSLVFGRAFDRFGIAVLVPLTIGSALFAPFVFLGGAGLAFVGTLLWGAGMGIHESIMAAAVAGMVPAGRIASAYGLFNLVYGLAWFAGSAAMGILYDVSISALVGFSIVAELLAVPLLLAARGPGR
jgi:predicted MFS family arabinose efflux permease